MGSFLGTFKGAKQNLAARRTYLTMHEQLRKGSAEPTLERVVSQLATQRQIDSELYRSWLSRLKLPATTSICRRTSSIHTSS
jgi:hypothetical protein